jgi:hypothetical protein
MICGIIAGLILRLLERIVLTREAYLTLQLKREFRDSQRTSDGGYSQLKSSNLLLIEDFSLGVIRGALVTYTSLLILSSIITIQNEIAFASILLGHVIIVIRFWNKKNRILDEAMLWIGDILAVVILFLVLSS